MAWGFNKGDGYHMFSLYFPKKGGPKKHVQKIPQNNHQELKTRGYMEDFNSHRRKRAKHLRQEACEISKLEQRLSGHLAGAEVFDP